LAELRKIYAAAVAAADAVAADAAAYAAAYVAADAAAAYAADAKHLKYESMREKLIELLKTAS